MSSFHVVTILGNLWIPSAHAEPVMVHQAYMVPQRVIVQNDVHHPRRAAFYRQEHKHHHKHGGHQKRHNHQEHRGTGHR